MAGEVRCVRARCGMVACGKAGVVRCGEVRSGGAWQGGVRSGSKVGYGLAGMAGLGWAWRGMARRGMARLAGQINIIYKLKGENMESKNAFEWEGHVYKTSADIAGAVMQELTEMEEGLTPKTLVNASRPKEAPLHPEFEWDDSIAGEKYREVQASQMIRCIKIKVEDISPKSQRAFMTVTAERNKPGIYEPIFRIMDDEEKRGKLIEQARRELEAFEKKYKDLMELREVLEAIRSYVERVA